MSEPRDQTYSFVNKVAREARQEIAAHPKDHNHYQAVEGGSQNDDRLHYLLNWVEDDRVHAEVHRILDLHMETMLLHGPGVGQGLLLTVKTIDPYHLVDGQLLRKSDGKVMHCEKCPRPPIKPESN